MKVFIELYLVGTTCTIHIFYKTKKCASLRYVDTCFMHNIGGVSDRRLHDSLSMYYIVKKSCYRLPEIPPILYI